MANKIYKVSLKGGTGHDAVHEAVRGAGRRVREGGHPGGAQLERVDVLPNETVVYLSGDEASVGAMAESLGGGGKPKEVGEDELRRGH